MSSHPGRESTRVERWLCGALRDLFLTALREAFEAGAREGVAKGVFEGGFAVGHGVEARHGAAAAGQAVSAQHRGEGADVFAAHEAGRAARAEQGAAARVEPRVFAEERGADLAGGGLAVFARDACGVGLAPGGAPAVGHDHEGAFDGGFGARGLADAGADVGAGGRVLRLPMRPRAFREGDGAHFRSAGRDGGKGAQRFGRLPERA
jgi:hypothetical protein